MQDIMNYQPQAKRKVGRPRNYYTGSGPYRRSWKELATPRESQSIEPCGLVAVCPPPPPPSPPYNDDDEVIMIDINFNISFNEMFSSLGVILKEIDFQTDCTILDCNGK